MIRALSLIFFLAVSLQAQKADLIQSISPFNPNSTIVLKPDPGCATLKTLPDAAQDSRLKKALEDCARRGPDKIETGSINGVAYQFYYSDGSGSFATDPKATFSEDNLRDRVNAMESAWKVGCEKDPITDEKSCHADRGDFRLWVDGVGRSEIYIGSSHYPGSQVVIRIDKTAPLATNSRIFNGSFGYRASPSIIKRIAAAQSVTTRYQKWPYTDYVDETWDTFGFKEALAYIKWAVARIN